MTIALDIDAGEQAAGSLEQAAAGMAHDLSKIAYVIEARARRLGTRSEVEAAAKDAVWIEECAREIRARLGAFMERCRRPEIDPSADTCVEAVVGKAISLASELHGEGRVDLVMPSRLPPLAFGRESLERVLVNLLDNALHASPPTGRVEIDISTHGNRLNVAISDRGPGISDELLQKVMMPYFTTRSDDGGTGLGLSVCRDCVRSLGGSLELVRRSGGGMRVEIAAPMLSEELLDGPGG